MNEYSTKILNPTFEKALQWIIAIFNNHSINYMLVGGVAANAYGSTRPINDIDFYIDFNDLEKTTNDLGPFITQKPVRLVDEHWNISFMKIFYKNQKIELGDIHNCSIYDKNQKIWVEQKIDLHDYNKIKINDVIVNVMKKDQLIEYKKILLREVDIQDIQLMQ